MRAVLRMADSSGRPPGGSRPETFYLGHLTNTWRRGFGGGVSLGAPALPGSGSKAALEAHPQPQPQRPRRGAEHRFLVVRVDRGRRGVVRLLEAPALVEKNRPLGVQQVEDVEEEVDRRRAGG